LKNTPPSTVSPGRGSLPDFTVMSVLMLPTTTICLFSLFILPVIIRFRFFVNESPARAQFVALK
jgi:hypothetical protein